MRSNGIDQWISKIHCLECYLECCAARQCKGAENGIYVLKSGRYRETEAVTMRAGINLLSCDLASLEYSEYFQKLRIVKRVLLTSQI